MVVKFEFIYLYLFSAITLLIIVNRIRVTKKTWADYFIVFCPIVNTLVILMFIILIILSVIRNYICTRLRL